MKVQPALYGITPEKGRAVRACVLYEAARGYKIKITIQETGEISSRAGNADTARVGRRQEGDTGEDQQVSQSGFSELYDKNGGASAIDSIFFFFLLGHKLPYGPRKRRNEAGNANVRSKARLPKESAAGNSASLTGAHFLLENLSSLAMPEDICFFLVGI